jgi:hypothetical protein
VRPISKSDNEAELIKLHFKNMLVSWGASQPLRTGLHASSVLVSDAEWCVREYVLAELFSDQARKPEMHPWDWKREAIFENGWDLHKRWQKIFKQFGKVVSEKVEVGLAVWRDEYELDRTHFDETRNIYFSPDAIIEFGGQRYVVEIKGIKQEAFEKLTDSLETAISVNETVAKARLQAQLYMHLLGLKKAILLIENKNTQDFKVWVIEYDKALSDLYIDRIYDVKRKLAVVKRDGLSKLPQRICQSRGDARAQKCPLRDCCFSERLENWQELEQDIEEVQMTGW